MSSLSQPFTDGLAQRVLRYQSCADCGRAQHLARYACAYCGGERLHWRDAAGRGTVVAASTVHRAPSDAFRPLAPYTLVLVELDEGVRVMGHAAPGTAIGDAVATGWLQHAGRMLPRFAPLSTPSTPADASP